MNVAVGIIYDVVTLGLQMSPAFIWYVMHTIDVVAYALPFVNMLKSSVSLLQAVEVLMA